MDTEGNFGGELTLANGEVRVAFVPAVHSSTVTPPPSSNDNSIHDGGNPGGFLISIQNGPTIYDTGDTDEFGDMALIPHLHKLDIMEGHEGTLTIPALDVTLALADIYDGIEFGETRNG